MDSSAQLLSTDGPWGGGGAGAGGSIAAAASSLLHFALARAAARPHNPARCSFTQPFPRLYLWGRSSRGRRHFLLPLCGLICAQGIDKYSSMAPDTPWLARRGSMDP